MLHCSTCGNNLRPETKFCGICGSSAIGIGTPLTQLSTASTSTNNASIPVGNPSCDQQPSGEQTFSDIDDLMNHVKNGEVKEASKDIYILWMRQRWGVRLTIIAVALCIITWLLLYAISGSISPPAGFLIGLVGIPIWLGFLIFLARPEPFVDNMFHFIQWSSLKRDSAREKETFVSKWFFRPLYGSFCLTANATQSVTDPYLRTGLMLGTQIVTVYVALFVAYAAIALVIAFACLIISLWFVCWLLNQSSGGSSSSVSSGWFPSGRSEVRTGFLGDKYIQHLDERDRKIGYSEQQTGFFGDTYTQHYTQDGKKAGTTEQHEGFFGDQYEQHYDQQGHKTGYSENRETFFGDAYRQHYDQEGNKTGRSEVREDFFGNKYIKNEEE